MSRQTPGVSPITVIFIIINILLIGGLVRNAISLFQARNRLNQISSRVADLSAQKELIETKLKTKTDAAALDQEIRDKLNLSKPGETVVIIPNEALENINQLSPEPQKTKPTAPIHQRLQLIIK